MMLALHSGVDSHFRIRIISLATVSTSTDIVCISDSLQLKEEGDIHREDRGGMMMGLYIGGGGG